MKLVSLGKREMALDLVQKEILSIQVRAGTSIFNDEIVLTLNIAAGLAHNGEPELSAELVMRDEITSVRPEALAAVGAAAMDEIPNFADQLIKKAISAAQNEPDLYLRANAYSKIGAQLAKPSNQCASLLKDVADLTRDTA